MSAPVALVGPRKIKAVSAGNSMDRTTVGLFALKPNLDASLGLLADVVPVDQIEPGDLHRGVDVLSGGWDLIEIGDDVFGAHIAVVDGGMRVGGKHYVITQLMGLTHGGVDAVVGLQTADDQALEVFAGQQFAQVSLVERIRGGFAYTQIFCFSQQAFGQLPAFGT